MMKIVALFLVLFHALPIQASDNWSQFRGTDGDGLLGIREQPLRLEVGQRHPRSVAMSRNERREKLGPPDCCSRKFAGRIKP